MFILMFKRVIDILLLLLVKRKYLEAANVNLVCTIISDNTTFILYEP